MNTDVFNIVNEHSVLTINNICNEQIVKMTCDNAWHLAETNRKRNGLRKIIKAIIPAWAIESPAHVAMCAIMMIAAISAIILIAMDFINLVRFGYVPELYDVWMPVFFTALSSVALITGRSEK